MLLVGKWPLLVGNVPRQPGEPIPEAYGWSNLRAYLDTGRVVEDMSNATLRVGMWPLQMDGKVRNPGDAIPEAKDWPNLRAYMDTGRVVLVPNSSSSDGASTPAQPVHSGGVGSPSSNPATPQRMVRRAKAKG